VAPSSSADKVAKLASKGKGKKVRFQGGTVFPVAVVAVLVLGLALIAYSRGSRPSAGAGSPRSGEHWHAVLGIYACDDNGLVFLPKITGNLEEQDSAGVLTNEKFKATGIHTHDDGVMHWHPNSTRSSGNNAKLKVFLSNYDIKLSDTKLELPTAQGGQIFEEKKTVCKIDGVVKDAQLKLWVWPSFSDVGKSAAQVYTAAMPETRLVNDGMVFVIAYVPKDVDPVAPEWAAQLPTLGAADSGSVTTTTVADPSATVVTTPTSAAGEPSNATTADTSTADTNKSDTSTATTGG
jgi:hypothetical protein